LALFLEEYSQAQIHLSFSTRKAPLNFALFHLLNENNFFNKKCVTGGLCCVSERFRSIIRVGLKDYRKQKVLVNFAKMETERFRGNHNFMDMIEKMISTRTFKIMTRLEPPPKIK